MPQDVMNLNENVTNPIAGELRVFKQKLRNILKYYEVSQYESSNKCTWYTLLKGCIIDFSKHYYTKGQSFYICRVMFINCEIS